MITATKKSGRKFYYHKQFDMKNLIVTLSVSFFICTIANGQTVGQQAKGRAVSDANANIDNSIDKSVDGAFNKTGQAVKGIFKKKNKKANNTATGAPANNTATGNATVSTTNTAASTATAVTTTNTSTAVSGTAFSDFTPGQTIIFQDDFSQDALNDFPAKWNSNGSGKVTTLNGLDGRWLELKTNTAVTPEMEKPLPENCTIEFDLYLDAQNGQTTPFIQFGLTQVKDILKEDMFYKERFFVNIHNYAEENSKIVEYGLQNDVLGTKGDFPILSYANKVLHVSMAVNKTRIRVYLDQTKVIDLPRALTTSMLNNLFLNSNAVIPAPDLDMYIANVRIASAETDARSLLVKQLMDEGKAVTNDILFDVNSDVIKQQSYQIINQIGDALKANPSLKIKITGHTDSDGSATANMELSKKRAASVKTYLLKNYSIADTRIQTDGKGASQPVADNSTAAGKAKNRRVEFTKL